MIQSFFKRNEAGVIVSCELTGHADAGPKGKDIVCASVSTLAISTANGIEALAGFTPLVDIAEEAGGYFYMELLTDVTQEQLNIAQLLLENLLLGLQAVADEYPEYIQIQTIK